jgi:hypothetical protein
MRTGQLAEHEGDVGGAGSQFSINDATVTEGNAGTKNVSFIVSLSNTSDQTVTVPYASADGSASPYPRWITVRG